MLIVTNLFGFSGRQVCPIGFARCYSMRRISRDHWRILGAPRRVVTDQGSEFVGSDMAERIESNAQSVTQVLSNSS